MPSHKIMKCTKGDEKRVAKQCKNQTPQKPVFTTTTQQAVSPHGWNRIFSKTAKQEGVDSVFTSVTLNANMQPKMMESVTSISNF